MAEQTLKIQILRILRFCYISPEIFLSIVIFFIRPFFFLDMVFKISYKKFNSRNLSSNVTLKAIRVLINFWPLKRPRCHKTKIILLRFKNIIYKF